MAAGFKVILFSLLILIPLAALFVYLILLVVRALRKYIKGSPARAEAKEVRGDPWGEAPGEPGPLQDVPGVRGRGGGCQPAGGQQMGERHVRPLNGESDRPGKAVWRICGGTSKRAVKA